MGELTMPMWLVIFGVVFFGGAVKGVVGFGYAIASTAILATIVDPSIAVVVMILPMLTANLSLIRELDETDLRPCILRFWPYILAAAVGTGLGMLLLNVVTRPLLALVLGLFTLGYVLTKQPWIVLPGEQWIAARCFRSSLVAKVGLGFVSGVVFGAANVGVQIVAYLDSLSLNRSTFVGVLALILVGVSSLRVGMAWALGLYASPTLLLFSALAAGPGVLGVVTGTRLRHSIPDSYQLGGVVILLTVIGIRLTSDGATALFSG